MRSWLNDRSRTCCIRQFREGNCLTSEDHDGSINGCRNPTSSMRQPGNNTDVCQRKLFFDPNQTYRHQVKILRDQITRKIVELRFVPSSKNLADMLSNQELSYWYHWSQANDAHPEGLLWASPLQCGIFIASTTG